MERVRVTVNVAAVLAIFLEDVGRSRYGYELMRRTGFASGKLYPVLAKLERAGWLIKEREDVDPAAAGRPVRRMYRLSPEGASAARVEIAQLRGLLRPAPAELAQPGTLIPRSDLR